MMDADDWDRRYADNSRAFSYEPNPLLAELASPLVAGRALDLAAGAGRNALWLAGRGWRVTAVDFSRVGLQRAESRAAELGLELDCVHADLYDYRPPAAAFELVLITYMHPRIDQRETVFAAAAEAVAPGGHLLVVGFDETDPHEGAVPRIPSGASARSGSPTPYPASSSSAASGWSANSRRRRGRDERSTRSPGGGGRTRAEASAFQRQRRERHLGLHEARGAPVRGEHLHEPGAAAALDPCYEYSQLHALAVARRYDDG